METEKGVGIVIDTDQPVSWHFVDNLSAFCTGFPGKLANGRWLARFFEDLRIDKNAKPYMGKDCIGRDAMQYPNPFARYIKAEDPCAMYSNNRYAYNGLGAYVDLQSKATLQGRLVSPVELIRFNKPAMMSVILFFSKRLHYLPFGIIESRAEQFCRSYPNAVTGRYHNIQSVHYVDDVSPPKVLTLEANQTPVEKMKVEIEEVGNRL